MTSLSLNKRNTVNPAIAEDFFKPWKEWVRSFYNDQDWNTLTIPAVNITEDKDNYKLSMAAPGMKKEDFHISMDGNVLTISSEKENEKEEKNGRISRQEFNYSSFSRSFNIPDTISKDKIEARYEDGILKLKLPKNEDAKKNGRNIQIPVK